jgi:hypothetical protein
MKTSICLICLAPRKIWLDFLSGFKHYFVFVVIDNTYCDYVDKYKREYPKLTFIQITNSIHIKSNFRDIEHPYTPLTGWHKALYYFSAENLEPDNVWFIEDDVFLYNENTIRMIDYNYVDSDYLSNVVTEYSASDSGRQDNITIKYELPWYEATVSAFRLSRTLLQKINEYAQTHQTLFYIGVMIPTIAHKNGLRCDCPKEMNYIRELDTINLNIIRHDMMYSPMKYIDSFPRMREFITDAFFRTHRK